MGRGEPRTGIAPFSRLVPQVREQAPDQSAERGFWWSIRARRIAATPPGID
jgi:hypothetical protein